MDHFISSCPYLPETGKKYLARTRIIQSLEVEEDYYREDSSLNGVDTSVEQLEDNISTDIPLCHTVNRVQIKPSTSFNVYYKHIPVLVNFSSS